mmetsp:Transcript_14455/g.37044  ORF Transcript_14455/g.37044 Transcript_14455/m.37044 type:complete len:458 (-) Transcript_14455:107-1480(-)
MLATPYDAVMHPVDMMSAWSWQEEAAAQEWATAQAGAAAWTQSEPIHMKMERLQQQMIHDLEQWKYLKYQAEAEANDLAMMSGWGYATDAAMPAGLLPEGLFAGAADEEGEGDKEVSGPPTPSVPVAALAGPAASAPSAFSALPMPKRVPVGTEPPIASALKAPSPREERGEAAGATDPVGFPPGLLLPPGLAFARAASLPVGADEEAADRRAPAASSRPQKPAGSTPAAEAGSIKVDMLGPMKEVSPGVLLGETQVSGATGTRAEWRIDSVRSKLQASMGRPLVSPPFAARGLPNLRLMVFPDAREAVRSARSRERKGMYAAMVKKGPLHGSLKLKADCLERATTALSFYLTVGGVRRGPLTYDFAECAIHGCDDFGTDWLKQVDDATGNLSVGVEILDEVEAGTGQEQAVGGSTSQLSGPMAPGTCGEQEQGSWDAAAGRAGRGKRASHTRLRGC